MRNTIMIAVALILAISDSTVAASLPGEGIEVQPLQDTIVEERFQTLIVNKALAALGYDVKPIKEVDLIVAYTSIASGDATYMTTNWYPLHDRMVANAGGDEKFYRKGHYIEGAVQGYLIDKKTADRYGITNLADFKKPEIAKLFDSNGDGKADLSGCQAGWGCEAVIEHHLDAYGLRDTVTHNQGQYAPIISDTIARYGVGESIFYYTWTPYWVSGRLAPGKDVVWLQVPFSSNPNGIDTTLPNGKNYGFTINSERIVANRAWAEKNPAAAKLFEIMKLPIHAVSAENMMIAKGEDSQKDIERHAAGWIKANQALFDRWIEAAKAAAK